MVYHNEENPAIATLLLRIEKMDKDFNSVLEAIRQRPHDGIECDCRLENRSHEINTRSVLNDLWTRQKFLEDRIEGVNSALANYREYKTGIEDLETDVMYLKERVSKLENMYQADYEKTKEVIFSLAHHKETINELIKWRDAAVTKNIQDVERIKSVENFNDEFKSAALEEIKNSQDQYLEFIKRVEKSEHELNDKLLHVQSENDSHCGAISVLEKWKEATIEKNIQDVERIRKLESENEMRKNTIGCLDSTYDEACDKIEERLNNLESNRLGQELDPKVWVFVNERLDRLETKTVLMPDVEETLKQSKWVHQQIERIDNRLNGFDIYRTQHLCQDYFLGNKNGLKPHKCPICDGDGRMWEVKVNGIASFGDSPVNCRSCEGKGIVWG